jgi:hypothetical protein
MAWMNDPWADPLGRGCGAPVPLPGGWSGGVTPWRSRHCRKAELCDVPEPDDDVPEPDDDVLAPQPAAARAAVSTTAPSTPGRAARAGRTWDRRVNMSPLCWRARPGERARARPGASPYAVKGAGLAISLRLPGSFLPGGAHGSGLGRSPAGRGASGQIPPSGAAASGTRA